MSIFIFGKNSDSKEGSLYRIASSQSVYDVNKNWPDDLYDVITVEDTDYTAVKLNTKFVVSKNGNQVTYINCDKYFSSQDNLISYINSVILTIEEWLINNNLKPLASNVTTYLNYLKSINTSSFLLEEEYPLKFSLETYVENQGTTAIHPLELL
tara:strand:+ start:419 stop:880 length:462 start_codon:yes stop_codon:yes gene_type:complete